MCSILKTHVFVAAFLALLSSTFGQDWCYSGSTCGQATWSGDCKTGQLQSPVNIVPSKAVKSKPGKKLQFSKTYYQPQIMYSKNDGKIATFQFNDEQTSNLFIQGSGLTGKYMFSYMQFHWGIDTVTGSEHTIKGRQYPLELQLVHKQDGGAGIAIVSVLFGIGKDRDNRNMEPIISALRNTEFPSPNWTHMMDSPVNLTALFPTVWDVFRYQGSLTQPPCTEKVVWSVFTQRVPISKVQLNEFRYLYDNNWDHILKNYRLTKPLKTNSRKSIYWMPINKQKMVSEAFD